ncbi:MAG: TRAP transporter large permease subunit, partial [Planctomycetota bacterium]|nr:TRAP transporter large permease subunit [Planctomycetota bacterium]
MAVPLLTSLVILLIVGVPIGLSMGASALIAVAFFAKSPAILIVQRHFTGVDSFPMMAIPFFLLGGLLMESGGVSRRLIDLISMFLGKIPGGIAVVNAVGSAFFGAISGSSPATVAAIGGVCVPGMLEEGYDKGFAAATAASNGFLGSIIPPSIIM